MLDFKTLRRYLRPTYNQLLFFLIALSHGSYQFNIMNVLTITNIMEEIREKRMVSMVINHTNHPRAKDQIQIQSITLCPILQMITLSKYILKADNYGSHDWEPNLTKKVFIVSPNVVMIVANAILSIVQNEINVNRVPLHVDHGFLCSRKSGHSSHLDSKQTNILLLRSMICISGFWRWA
jgi:hypothetical protein